MIAETKFKEEAEKIFSPETDRSNMYGIIFIIVSIIVVYVSIITHQIWAAFFIVIPFLYISRKEEQGQKKKIKARVLSEISNIMNFVYILFLIGIVFLLFIKIGFLITAIIVIVAFKSWSYISGAITRRNFEKHNDSKSLIVA